MMNKWTFLVPLLFFSQSSPILAHGANINYRETQAIQIQATYDDGTPMANAQVVVYSPEDPATPWLKGNTDEEGYFSFVPDSNQQGNWDIKVRQSGHGDIISIPFPQQKLPLAENTSQSTTSASTPSHNTPYTPMQKIIMAIVGVWGFVGTALFFSRTPRNKVEE